MLFKYRLKQIISALIVGVRSFLSFHYLVGPKLIKIGYFVGTIVVFYVGVRILLQGGIMIAVGVCVIAIGNLLWRFLCETLISVRGDRSSIIASWTAIIALLVSFVNLWFYHETTYPTASVEILARDLCVDSRYLENELFKDSVFLQLKFINSSLRRPTELKWIKIDVVDPEDTTLAVVPEFVDRPEFMEPGQSASCLLRLKILRMDVSRLKYTLPLRLDQRLEYSKLSKSTGLDLLVNLHRQVHLHIRVAFVGCTRELDFETKAVKLIEVAQRQVENDR